MCIPISYPHSDTINHIVIQPDNISLYFKSFDQLLVIMDLADNIHNDDTHPLTYVLDHDSESDKIHYHQGIDSSYSDDAHYHFERKDNKPLSYRDIKLFLNTLKQFDLIEMNDIKRAKSEYKTSREQEIRASYRNRYFTPLASANFQKSEQLNRMSKW
ncbi:hypothetical protein B1207_06560 [Legionella quinlivanii]|uniref:Uncharacterized protein n=1 Tax=Legionella quinlivanii TaxID=45073 RepID=A0A364LKD7_9GAMM|nr:hypothetical protein [Legionella quinlivanii]RAP37077.1 hypothetical protein B1207_06560 [Legionella quinlivanii]